MGISSSLPQNSESHLQEPQEMSIAGSLWGKLPTDAKVQVLHRLSAREAARVRSVSKEFREVIDSFIAPMLEAANGRGPWARRRRDEVQIALSMPCRQWRHMSGDEVLNQPAYQACRAVDFQARLSTWHEARMKSWMAVPTLRRSDAEEVLRRIRQVQVHKMQTLDLRHLNLRGLFHSSLIDDVMASMPSVTKIEIGMRTEQELAELLAGKNPQWILRVGGTSVRN